MLERYCAKFTLIPILASYIFDMVTCYVSVESDLHPHKIEDFLNRSLHFSMLSCIHVR